MLLRRASETCIDSKQLCVTYFSRVKDESAVLWYIQRELYFVISLVFPRLYLQDLSCLLTLKSSLQVCSTSS